MSQSKRGSMIETVTGTAIGYSVAVVTQVIVFPWFGLQVSTSQNLLIAAVFTIISLVRGYWVRRLFNYMHTRGFLT
jgi:hypothetical protein